MRAFVAVSEFGILEQEFHLFIRPYTKSIMGLICQAKSGQNRKRTKNCCPLIEVTLYTTFIGMAQI